MTASPKAVIRSRVKAGMSSTVRCSSCVIVITTLVAGGGQECLEAEGTGPGQVRPGGVTLFDSPRGRGPWGCPDGGGAPLALGADDADRVLHRRVAKGPALIGDQAGAGGLQ